MEICATIDAIRYLFKYVFKGTDQTGFEIQAGNEVAEYRQGRYIGPTQAAWHILEFPFHHQHPTVHALSVHLPDQQPVYFPDDLTGAELRERMETAKSQLMAFFDYYRRHPEAPKYHYVDFPQYFVWVQATRQWKTRERGFAIGRLYNCSPLHGERYYLRLLLLVVPGPTSFEDLRTVNGVVYPTFRAACLAAGLLDDDNEWFQAFDEAVQVATGWALRNLFTTALIYGAVADPQRLWDRYNTSICDDLPHRLRQLYIEVVDDDHLDFGLFLVKQVIVEEYARDYGQLGLAEPRRDWSAITRDHDHADDGSQPTLPRVTVEQLNRGQRACFDRITAAILDRPETAHFFIQGPGGTGKTFLYNCLYRWMTETGQKVLCVASSGIAAVLLPYGQTAHSQFTIPLEIHETSTCCVPRQSLRAAFLRSLGLIIWDEVPMQHRFCFEAVDRLMQDLHQNNLLFGGIPVVLGGDFAQILPVVKRGRRADIVGASLQRSYVWSRLEVLQLTENMRLQEGALNTQYAHWLRQLSYRPEYHSSVEIPEPVQIVDSLDTLLDHVFPAAELSGGQDQRDQIKFWAGRAILTVRNEHLGEINHAALSAIPGEPRVYQSVNTAAMDTTGVENDANMLPPEYLRAIDLPGLPPAQLQLKVGVPVMLLRNLRPRQGLCNGTRLLITALHRHLIEARILTGSWAGRRCVIPRVQLSSNDGDLHFTLTRRQFPVRLCFAMTVNKSQGQSLETVGDRKSVV